MTASPITPNPAAISVSELLRQALRRNRYRSSGAALRRRTVLWEIAGATAWCLAGFAVFINAARHVEVWLSAGALGLLGETKISGALGDSFLIFGPGDRPLVAELTASCSALTSLLALSALAVFVLRRRPHALGGFLVAAVWIVLANQLRLILSLLAGVHLDVSALVLFHDWVGALLNFAYTLVGLLIMIALTMHSPERAEQDRSGRHTAGRPDAWARPGLGYRVESVGRPARTPRIRIASFVHRRLLPSSVSRKLAARRERGRIDYRLGHLDPAERAAAVRELAGRGLGVHTATLVAVATHETAHLVLDALADAVAARQWEPVSDRQITALRLWSRAWIMRAEANPSTSEKTPAAPAVTPGVAPARPAAARRGRLVAVTGAGGPAGVAVIRALRAAGHRVLALDADPDAVGLRLGDTAAVLPRADADGYGEALLGIVTEHRPAALICTVAEEYAALGAVTARLTALGCRTWLPDTTAVRTCLNKAMFAAALHARGVPHPATATTREGAGALPGPWIVKPAGGRGSRDVHAVDTAAELDRAFATVAVPIAQTRLTGREFTADVLVARDGTMLTCVPRWRDETRAGISVRGSTFDSAAVTRVVGDTLRAVGLTGPANVQGFVADPAPLADDPDAEVAVSVVEVNPRFSGGLPLTLAAGADVVGSYLTGILEPGAPLPRLSFQPGVRMARHFAEVYYAADGTAVADPLIPA
ncbi:ATP-grasp domain-containing protein [Micromonospora sp. NPDC049679]|uniref:ATP-grasp domain-containing protein n=1 Tax=Micromonospora sp. NPDC049679 TaxID=3155920 RepID=UPI0033F3AB65